MKNYWITVGAVFGFLAVALGAFGAHQLKNIVSPEMLDIFKTGVQYHLIHAVIITAIGFYGNPKFFLAAFFFSIGIFLFSFSILSLYIDHEYTNSHHYPFWRRKFSYRLAAYDNRICKTH